MHAACPACWKKSRSVTELVLQISAAMDQQVFAPKVIFAPGQSRTAETSADP